MAFYTRETQQETQDRLAKARAQGARLQPPQALDLTKQIEEHEAILTTSLTSLLVGSELRTQVANLIQGLNTEAASIKAGSDEMKKEVATREARTDRYSFLCAAYIVLCAAVICNSIFLNQEEVRNIATVTAVLGVLAVAFIYIMEQGKVTAVKQAQLDQLKQSAEKIQIYQEQAEQLLSFTTK